MLFNLPNVPPAITTEKLAAKGFGVRDGHMYSPRLMKRLGLSHETGAVRVSLVQYSTLEENCARGKDKPQNHLANFENDSLLEYGGIIQP